MKSIVSEYSHKKLIIYLNNVLKMGRLTQGMFFKLKDSYFEKNKSLSEEVVVQDDRLDFLESKLEAEGMALIGSSNFTGKFLKANLVGLKLTYVFEIMGDLCEEAAKLNIELLKLPQRINLNNFEDIFMQAQEMLSISLRMFSDFINLEIKKLTVSEVSEHFLKPAKDICILKQEVSSLLKAYKRSLYRSKDSIKSVNLHLIILTNIETFSDFTTNVSENVIWAIKGARYKCRNNKLEYFFSLEDEI